VKTKQFYRLSSPLGNVLRLKQSFTDVTIDLEIKRLCATTENFHRSESARAPECESARAPEREREPASANKRLLFSCLYLASREPLYKWWHQHEGFVIGTNAFLNAGEIGTKMFMALVDFRVRAPSSNEILAKQMQTCKTLFSSKIFSPKLNWRRGRPNKERAL
jgi:hypothetical protein